MRLLKADTCESIIERWRQMQSLVHRFSPITLHEMIERRPAHGVECNEKQWGGALRVAGSKKFDARRYGVHDDGASCHIFQSTSVAVPLRFPLRLTCTYHQRDIRAVVLRRGDETGRQTQDT
jgi:hypothetical protein